MNAQCYRVIFNKARGMLMVVSEAARSQGKTSNPSEGGSSISQTAGGSQTTNHTNGYYQGGQLNSLRSHLLLALGMATIISTSFSTNAHADSTKIVADRNAAAAQQAAILKASNGTAQVNIQTPSAAGVSRNVFSQFDVGSDGAILNNSRTNAQTQIAGWVEGNPYLARGEARVILNEINSSDPSRLGGYTEIAGGKDELIIANPAGISCAGCGFINASRTTLTTGQTLMEQGKLTGFDVTGGKVRIDGDGLDNSSSDYTQIIANTTDINASVYAKNLDVITGSNKVSYEADAKDTVITSKSATNSTNQATGVALDVSALGAMYAGKIRLIGTEKGMGVTNAGSIIASSGGLQLDSNGNLINSGSLVANQNKIDINTQGSSIDNSGTIASSRGSIDLKSSALTNSGVMSSYDALTSQQTGNIDNSGEIAAGSFDIQSAALKNSGKLLQTGTGNLSITAQQLINQQGAVIGQDLYADNTNSPTDPTTTPPSTATNGSSIGSSTDGSSQSTVTPDPLPIITQNGRINTGNLTNTGSIYTNGDINVSADSVANQDKSSLVVSTLDITDDGSVSNTDSRLQLESIDWQLTDFDNTEGQVITNAGINISTNSDIDNTKGTLASNGDITLNANGDINNNSGVIQSGAKLTTDSNHTDNSSGKLISQEDLTINSRGDLTNTQGAINSAKDAVITSISLDNDNGQITAQGSLTTSSDSVNNSGQIYGKTDTQLTATDTINNSGTIASGGNVDMTTGSLTQTDSGSLVAGMSADGTLLDNSANINVLASGDITSQGNHIATGDVSLSGDDINLSDSNSQGSSISTTARTGINTTNASITATDKLTLSSTNGTLDNTAGVLSGGVLEIDANRLNNTDGKLTQTGKQDLTLALVDGIDNTRGEIASNSDSLTLNTTTLDNSSGKIVHAGTNSNDDSRLSINADRVNNTEGEILSLGAQTWQVAKDVDNTSGVIQANRFTISAQNLDNTDGRIVAVNTTQAAAQNTASSNNQLQIQESFTNAGTGIVASDTGSLIVTASDIDNKGQISSVNDLSLKTRTLTNSGSLYSQADVDINNQGAMSNTGSIAAQGNTTVNTGSLVQSADGQLIAGLTPTGVLSNTTSNLTVNSIEKQSNAGTNIATGNVELEGSELDLTDSRNQSNNLSMTASAGDIRLDKANTNVTGLARLNANGNLSNDGGVLQAGQFDWQVNELSNVVGTINQTGKQAFNLVTNGTINNQKGVIGGNAISLNIDSKSTLDNTEGMIVHGGDGSANVTANQLSNIQGTIVSTQALTTKVSGDLDNSEGVIQGDTLNLNAKTLTNNNGQLVSQNGDLNLSSESVSNQGDKAYIQSGNNLTINSDQLTNSDSATIMAKGFAEINITNALDNKRNAIIASDENMMLQAGTLTNSAQIAALAQDLTINATSVDNQIGGQISAADDTAIVSSQDIKNQGIIAASNQLDIQAVSTINNKEGVLSGGAITLNSNADINNENGLIAQTNADQALSINAKGNLNNKNTNTVNNLQTGILANGTADIDVDSINNQSGIISAKQLTIDTASDETVNNAQGLLQAAEALTLTANKSDTLDNQGGQIVADTINLTVGDANRGRIDNNVAGSLIQAGTNIDITTGVLNNQNTKQSSEDKSQGVIANDTISITASTINNQSGQLLANNKVMLTAGNQINNQAGSIQSNDISIVDTDATNRRLAVNNDNGRIAASNDIMIRSKDFTNTNGEVLANGRADINIVNDISYDNTNTINANEVVLTTQGSFTNSSQLSGQNALTINAQSISNQKDAELTSNGTTELNAATNIDNRGLINGEKTYLDAGNTVNNYSNGRIYGDHVAIEATTLNNTPDVFTKTQVDECVAGPGCLVDITTEFNNVQGWSDAFIEFYKTQFPDAYNQLLVDKKTYYKVTSDPAPVIAARQRLDIGVSTLTNNPNEARAGFFNEDFTGQAKIISNGELHIGGSLDDNHQAVGSATTVTNKGASIESVGDMSIDTNTLNNVNADFALKPTKVETYREEDQHEYQLNGSTNRYDESEIQISKGGHNGSWVTYLTTPENENNRAKKFYEWKYDVVTLEDQVMSSDPSRILSGGQLNLFDTKLTNDKSIIIARKIKQRAGSLVNDTLQPTGYKATEYENNGSQEYYIKRKRKHDGYGSKSDKTYTKGAELPFVASKEIINLPILSTGVYAVAIEGVADIDKTEIDNSEVRELRSISDAIQTLTNDKPTANDANSATTVGASGLANAAKLLEGFAKADDSTLTDAQKQQLQALLDAQKQGSKVDQAAIDDLINHITDQIAQTASEEIRSSDTTVKLPNSSLYGTNPDSNADYLVETDPAFANYKDWLSSDYMLERLQLDPNITQKRLGDGYYEQQYIRDQIMTLTGRYYLGDYRSLDEQYKGLMDAGITTAQTLNLRPGIALTDSQVAQLTTDMVWLVQQQITLADGSSQQVLVPKVYTRQAVGQIDGTGSLIAADSIDMQLSGDLTNQGSIVGHQSVNINATNLTNANGGLIKGDYVQIGTANDLNNLSGTLQANKAMQLDVGGDLNNESLTYTTSSAKDMSSSTRTDIRQIASIYVGDGLKGQVDEKGNALTTFIANVGGDTTFAAGRFDNQGGSSRLDTKGDVALDAVNTSYQSNSIGDANNYFKQGESIDVGSQINGIGNVFITSGSNITGTASQISSNEGTVGLQADNDITLKEGRYTQNLSTATKTISKDFLSKETTQDRYDMQSDTAISSNIEGNTVVMQAGADISLTGTNAISDTGTGLTAGDDVNILAADNTSSETKFSQTKKSGLFGTSGGIGFTIGKQQTDDSNAKTALTHTGSNIAAIDGNVTINAGGTYQQTGSSIVAGLGADSSEKINDALDNSSRGNVVVRAQDINIDNVMDVYTNQSEQKFKQSGLTVSVSNSLIDSAKSIDNLIDAGGNTGSTRMKGMAGVAAGLKAKALAKQGSDVLSMLQESGKLQDIGSTRIQATIGSSKSESNSSSYTEVNQGSSITTNNLALIATGAGTDSNIDINGSNLNVNKDALFQADNDLNINGVAQNSNTRSDNKSSSTAIGAYAATNPAKGASYGITASASRVKGYANSDSTTYANSQVNVGGNTTLDINNDLNIKGGVLNTDKIQGVIGGDMTIESLQDTATYDSDQKNMGFSADLDLAKGTGSSLSVNGGKTNVDSDYKGVGEQSGIFTNEADLTANGKGSFTGAVFTTSKEAQANGKSNIVFKQGISSQDIKNTTSYEGEALSIGLSIGNTTGKPQATMNGIGYGTDSDSDSSITKGGVSGYNDPQGILTTDNREALGGKLESVFDANRVNEELGAQTQITQEFGKEAPKAVAEFSQNRIDDIRANPNLSADEKMAAISKWDEGGIYRVAAHTALGALGTGSVEGALTTGGVAAAAPTINNLEAKMRDALIAQGMDVDTASNATKGITSLALAGAGVAAGLDTASTINGVNVDANNRQLHFSEMQKLNESAKALAKKYGRDAEYWKSLLYAVTYSELDKKGNDRLATFKKDFAKPAYSQNAQAFEKIIENDIAIAKQSYNSLKAKYGNVELEKDRHTSVSQSKPIYMFSSSGYYNENSIYGTYGGSYQGNRNNQKDFNKVTKNLNSQMSDIATQNDRINPIYLEQYYIPLSELKAAGATGIAVAKNIAGAKAKQQSAKEAAETIAQTCSTGECFTAGTLIHTIHGLKPIETIDRGELVWSREEFGNKYDYRPVIATKVTPNIPIYEVKIKHDNGLEETINTTEEHPFWIDGEGWRKASILEAGMKLLDKHGRSTATVVSQTALDKKDTVYNFEVQDFSTYHIGEMGVWVHNANCCDLTSIIVNGKQANVIGTGGNKIVYSIDEKTVIGKLKSGKPLSAIQDEAAKLQQLKDLGFPVVNARITTHDGAPAMIMDRYAQGSKDIIARNSRTGNIEVVANANTSLLNGNSVRDLQAIRTRMVDKKISVNDLQFLISKDGHVVIADPIDVYTRTKPSKPSLRTIDLLIIEARKN